MLVVRLLLRYATSRLVGTLLYGVKPHHPWTMAAVFGFAAALKCIEFLDCRATRSGHSKECRENKKECDTPWNGSTASPGKWCVTKSIGRAWFPWLERYSSESVST